MNFQFHDYGPRGKTTQETGTMIGSFSYRVELTDGSARVIIGQGITDALKASKILNSSVKSFEVCHVRSQ